MAYMGKEYLKFKLSQKKRRCEERYIYYEMKNHVEGRAYTIPDGFNWLNPVLGWSAKAVDAIADRLDFRGFDNDVFGFNDIFNLNNPDVLYDSAMLSALITSCSFIYISADEQDYPRLQVIDGRKATGIIDPVTGMLSEGYAVLETNQHDQPTLEAYFTKEQTVFYTRDQEPYAIPNIAPYALLVPIIFKPDPKRPFGHSRITRACIGLQQEALRTIRRSEVSAEFYSFPQKYVLGLSQDAEQLDKYRATMSSFLQFDKDEDGDHPTVGQFQQQSMSPYYDQVKMFAGLFAGETGLTLDDLGFPTENPSSVEAIKAQHENLRLVAKKAQKTFGSGFLNAGYLASCLRDNFPYRREQVYLTVPKWNPLFEPDAATLSMIGDSIIKANQAIPGYFNRDNLRDLTGIVGGEESETENSLNEELANNGL